MKSVIKIVFVFLFLVTHCISAEAQSVVQMEKSDGVYKIPCVVNGLKLKFVFDTGAYSVCLSESTALMMLENDYLSPTDIKGTSKSKVADGRIVDNTQIILKELKIGDKVLTNVDAIVVSGQAVPLLLGQSAISRLGEYSISGDKLIVGSSKSNQQRKKMSKEELLKVYEEADKCFWDGNYFIAQEKYKILEDYDCLFGIDKLYYADCCRYNYNFTKALDVYFEVEEETNYSDFSHKDCLYLGIGRTYSLLEDYSSAIVYLEKAKYYSMPFGQNQKDSVCLLSLCYSDNNNSYRGREIIDKYLKQYLEYMDINATDCWDKSYVDEFLAELYYVRGLGNNYDDFKKYVIISAAWGNAEAKEWCEKNNMQYATKPHEYEY